MDHVVTWEELIQAEGTASEKALRQDHAWHV